jgi:hypothetical protein
LDGFDLSVDEGVAVIEAAVFDASPAGLQTGAWFNTERGSPFYSFFTKTSHSWDWSQRVAVNIIR